MSSLNERERHLSMLRAAIPYASPQSRRAMEIILQADTLINLATSRPEPELSSCGLEAAETNNAIADPLSNAEALLMHIREFCTPKESETIQVILNFIHADRLFKNYKDFANAHPDMVKAAEVPSGSSSNSSSPNTSSNVMMEFLMSQLNPEQKTAFEQLQNIMYN
ncbi:MAG: hypothetical protein MR384_08000 [Lachnospiraceae bacterium]|nr:hypothetical protein [Lachnospiraceae bacterium]MCI5587806.1 hypothetical protein [Lachnospiraceae bacterium]